MKNFDDILKEMRACSDAKEWVSDKDFQTVWETCHRGDWMGWLVDELKINKRLRVLVAGHCANTVRDLMTDERSTNAVDVAIRYGNGEATDEELEAASDAAWSARSAWSTVSAAAAAGYASDAARSENPHQTADIIRQYIPIEMMIEKLNTLYP